MSELPAVAPLSPSPGKRLRKVLLTFIKIAIAVLGIWYVCRKVSWDDSATLLPTANVQAPAGINPPDGIRGIRFPEPVQVDVLAVQKNPGRAEIVTIRFGNRKVRMEVAGEQIVDVVSEDLPTKAGPLGLPNVVSVPQWMLENTNGQYVHRGLHGLVVQASSKWHLLLGAWILLGIPFFVTAIRWRNLMRPQGIDMPLGKCLQLTFVGQFYSIILPGITGGDLVKIVYAARLTGSKTKSFITIILDRLIGLIALMVIAGTSAGVQLILDMRNPAAGHLAAESHKTLLNVFILIVSLLACVAIGSVFYFSRRMRKLIGIEWFIENFGQQKLDAPIAEQAHLERLFRVLNGLVLVGASIGITVLCVLRWVMHSGWAMRNTPAVIAGICIFGAAALCAAMGLALHRLLVSKATPLMGKLVQAIVGIDETLHVYRGHFGLLAWAFFISVISQLTLPLSAWLSGSAFGMNAPVTHYMAYVPLAVLAASLPISPPQGAGFLEWVLDHFFVSKGEATASQAFALTQSVRFLPILWNLVGAYWVITGKYSRKTEPAA